MSGVLFACVGLAALAQPAQEDCGVLRDRLASLAAAEPTEAFAAYRDVVDALPEGFESVRLAAGEHAGDDGSLQTSGAILRAAVEVACRPAAPEASTLRTEIDSVLVDPRFSGKRPDPDLIDQWLNDLQLWIFELLESRGMQRYASSSRLIYLAALAATAAFVAFRLWRARRSRSRRGSLAGPPDDEIEVRRRRRADAWLDEARAALAAEDWRRVFEAGLLAVLARVGEVEGARVPRSRTNREVLARLDASRAAAIAGSLKLYEAAVYAAQPDGALARGFVSEVERALTGLGGRGAAE